MLRQEPNSAAFTGIMYPTKHASESETEKMQCSKLAGHWLVCENREEQHADLGTNQQAVPPSHQQHKRVERKMSQSVLT